MSNSPIFDEMYGLFEGSFDISSEGEGAETRIPYSQFANWLDKQNLGLLQKQSKRAQDIFRSVGITFNVYGESDGVERLIPFDMIPRILAASEWKILEAGIRQRVTALNAFLYDIYHTQEIVRAGVIPASLINDNDAFVPQMMNFASTI